MKTRKQWYAFSKEELEILREIARGSQELVQIERELHIKPNLLSYHLGKLQQKEIITIKPAPYKAQKESKVRKKAVFTLLNHSNLLKALIEENQLTEKWEKALSGLGIEVLFSATSYPRQTKSVSYPTFWRYSKILTDLGILTLNDMGHYQINTFLFTLNNFIREYQAYIAERTLEKLPGDPKILWQKGSEFLIKVLKGTIITQEGFQKTATSVLSRHRIVNFEEFEVYFYSRFLTEISLEETILHILLIEKKSAKYSTYSYLLLNQELRNIDEESLLNAAKWYGLSIQISRLLNIAKFRLHS